MSSKGHTWKLDHKKQGNPCPVGCECGRHKSQLQKLNRIIKVCIYPNCHNFIYVPVSQNYVVYCTKSHGRGPRNIDARYSHAFVKLREKIKERDGFACLKCGMIETAIKALPKGRLEVHHLDHDPENLSESNLITLCSSCHQSGHRKGTL